MEQHRELRKKKKKKKNSYSTRKKDSNPGSTTNWRIEYDLEEFLRVYDSEECMSQKSHDVIYIVARCGSG